MLTRDRCNECGCLWKHEDHAIWCRRASSLRKLEARVGEMRVSTQFAWHPPWYDFETALPVAVPIKYEGDT